MADRFKLESVLKHRIHLEENAQRVFAESSRKWDEARHTLDRMTRDRRRYQRELRDKMHAATAAGELLLYHRYLGRLQHAIAVQRDLVADLAAEREEKREQLLAALKNRKIIEKLKDRFQEQNARREQHQEQKYLNEAALNRYQGRPGTADQT